MLPPTPPRPPASLPPPSAKERALAEQQEALLQARADADRKLDALNARQRGLAERERELDARQQTLMQQVEAAQAELERRQADAEQRLEALGARERALRRQEDGLEGLKVRGVGPWQACCSAGSAPSMHLLGPRMQPAA